MFGRNVLKLEIDIVFSEHFFNRPTSNHPPSDVHFVEIHDFFRPFDQYILMPAVSEMNISELNNSID